MSNLKNSSDPKQIKEKIIKLFLKNVKGKTPDTSASNINHDGKGGHWLETQMNVKHNASNTPDIDGFEMKNHTSIKTTFGDWSPNQAIWKGKNKIITRDTFLNIFGAPNPEKENRHSWSGKPCPKINSYNTFGQKLEIDTEGNILAIYSFSKDLRKDKNKIVPKDFQKDKLILAKWENNHMKIKVERKFNSLGWFKCEKNSNSGAYTKIVFGNPINFDTWIDGVRKGLIFFDSGMYAGNPRPYSQWRANNKYWESLVTESY